MLKAMIKIAKPYDKDNIEKIKTHFRYIVDPGLEFDVVEDNTLIGGFIAYVNGKVYDASIKTKLYELSSHINKKRSIKHYISEDY